jgi:hypothetical protein
MARGEARIFTSIWKDQDFLDLSPTAQRLYMFLLSQDDLTYCGVLPLRERRWASKAAGLSAAEIEVDLKTLEGTAYPSANPPLDSARTPFVITDHDTGELFVRSLMRRDGIWKQPNLLKLAMEAAEQIESPQIRGALLAELRRLPVDESPSKQVKTLVAEFVQFLEQGSPYPTAYPAEHPGPDPSDDPSDDPAPDPTANGRPRAGFPLTPIPGSPTDLSAPPATDRKLGTRLPDHFVITAEMETWAVQHAPHVDAHREFDRFRDHWRAKAGKDGRKVDWLATWRNWMRTAEDRQGPRNRPPPRGDPRQEATDEMFADAAVRMTGRNPDDTPGNAHADEVRQGSLPAAGHGSLHPRRVA